ncbi:protein of unknown function (plasmid) [Cupriavidus taiwanensis]|uniref:Uncharacterized protein n=1 Tax=Cupriavidus taiwanensis TaxID=164546 RepID=A0A375I7G9_9BURK|nr:hypothetical protein CT19425_U600081 [Cupriavidus taiwanensis]SPK77038.1 protein of unknown function [Cupriavidus taiwanensis]
MQANDKIHDPLSSDAFCAKPCRSAARAAGGSKRAMGRGGQWRTLGILANNRCISRIVQAALKPCGYMPQLAICGAMAATAKGLEPWLICVNLQLARQPRLPLNLSYDGLRSWLATAFWYTWTVAGKRLSGLRSPGGLR